MKMPGSREHLQGAQHIGSSADVHWAENTQCHLDLGLTYTLLLSSSLCCF